MSQPHGAPQNDEPNAAPAAEPQAEPVVLEDAPRLFGGLRTKSRVRAGLTVKQKIME
jgi:hypothetical protein